METKLSLVNKVSSQPIFIKSTNKSEHISLCHLLKISELFQNPNTIDLSHNLHNIHYSKIYKIYTSPKSIIWVDMNPPSSKIRKLQILYFHIIVVSWVSQPICSYKCFQLFSKLSKHCRSRSVHCGNVIIKGGLGKLWILQVLFWF